MQVLEKRFTLKMYYSAPRGNTSSLAHDRIQEKIRQDWLKQDWTCIKCGGHNFKRREHCFKCSTNREDSERARDGDGYDQVGTNPCNTLIFRGLDALTTEDTLLTALAHMTSLQLKNVKVIRDDVTAVSRCFAFVELHSVRDSTEVLDALQKNQPVEIDGKGVMVDFAKNSFTTTMATIAQAALTQSQYPDYSSYYQQAGYDLTASGQYYDAATGQYYSYADYYAQQQRQAAAAATAAALATAASTAAVVAASTKGNSIQTDTTNVAAAVAQAAIQQAQAVKQLQKQQEDVQKQVMTQMQEQQKLAEMTAEQRLTRSAEEWSKKQSKTLDPNTKYPTPDVSTYTYDESSGYYFDASTGLYYDSTSQYYYNSETAQFLYWDGEKQNYLPAPTDEAKVEEESAVMEEESENKDEEIKIKKEKEKKEKEKVKVAKKIQKDMEKWAKSMNASKISRKEAAQKSIQPGPVPDTGAVVTVKKESAAADAGFALLEKKSLADLHFEAKRNKDDKKLMPPPPMLGQTSPKEDAPLLVASYGGDSDSEDEPEEGSAQSEEAKLADWTKMACLLCKRQFANKEALTRHNQLSDLHKKNLEDHMKARGITSSESQSQTIQYRDRAKERRKKFGVPGPPLPRKQKVQETDPVPFEQPTQAGIGGDNIGNKLLQKMGWSAGQGLGKANQGITNPLKAVRRAQSAGLGASGSAYNIDSPSSYKDAVKKTMMARFQEME